MGNCLRARPSLNIVELSVGNKCRIDPLFASEYNGGSFEENKRLVLSYVICGLNNFGARLGIPLFVSSFV